MANVGMPVRFPLPNIGRIERGLVVMRCVFWMFATGVLASIKREDVEKHWHSQANMFF